MSTPAAIVPRTKIVGANHGESQISATPWNEPRIVTGGALGGLFVRDPLLADGWGLIDAGLANTVLVGGGATAMPAWSSSVTLTSITVDTITAGSIVATGPLKLANNQYLQSRNAANSADVNLIGLNASNVLSFGPSVAAFGSDVYALSGSMTIANGGNFRWQTQSRIASPADGILLVSNGAGTDFGRLLFGGLSGAFPALKRSGTTLACRLADDSTDAPFTCSNLSAGSITATGGITVSGPLKLANNVYLQSRNAGNTADVNVIGLDVNNTVNIAPSGAQETLVGFNLVVLGNVKVPPNALMYWVSAVQLKGVAAGQLNLLSDVGTSGVGFDVSTDSTLKIRNRAQTADGLLTCAQITTGNCIANVVAVGPTYSSQGSIRLSNNEGIASRNAANNGNQYLLYLNDLNQVVVGSAGAAIVLQGPIAPSGGVLQIGGAITCTPYIAVGVNPAQAGTIRIPNNNGIYSRNAANNGDLPVFYYDTSDRLVLGYAGQPVIPYSINQDLGVAPGGAATWRQGFFSSGVAIGNLPAQAGPIRLTCTQYITSRNGANTADIALLGLHSDNVIYMGSSGCLGVCPYNPATALGLGSAPWASLAIAGAASVGSVVINNTISLTAAAAVLSCSGDIISNGDNGFRAPAIGGFYWQGRTFIACPASGQLLLYNSLGNIGVGLDFATDGMLKIRTRAQTGDAGLTAGSLLLMPNPPQGIAIHLPNGPAIYSRNLANTVDGWLIGMYTDNVIHVGDPAFVTNLRGSQLLAPSLTVSGTVTMGALALTGNASVGGSLFVTGNIAVTSPGPHVIGAAGPAVQYRLRVTGTFPREYGYVDDGTLQVPIGVGESSSMVLLATIALPASGNTSIISGIRISPQVSSAGATATDAAGLEVFAFGGAGAGSITGVAANRAIWAHNNVQVDGALQFGGMTSSFPGLRRNGTGLQAVVGTGTGLADFQCGAAAATNATIDTLLKVGPNPATTGEVRLPNNGEGIAFRNNLNTGNIYGLYTDSANNVVVGDSVTSGTRFPAASISLRTAGIVFIDAGARALAIGSLPAQSGPLRLAYNSYITARESTNTADRRLIGFYQNVDLDADASGVSFHGGRSLLICPADGTFELHNRAGNLWATLLAGQIVAKTGSLVVGSSPGLSEFGTNSIALGGATTIACVQTSFAPVTSNLADGMWWVEATGTTPSRQLRIAVRDGGATYYQNIGAAH